MASHPAQAESPPQDASPVGSIEGEAKRSQLVYEYARPVFEGELSFLRNRKTIQAAIAKSRGEKDPGIDRLWEMMSETELLDNLMDLLKSGVFGVDKHKAMLRFPDLFTMPPQRRMEKEARDSEAALSEAGAITLIAGEESDSECAPTTSAWNSGSIKAAQCKIKTNKTQTIRIRIPLEIQN